MKYFDGDEQESSGQIYSIVYCIGSHPHGDKEYTSEQRPRQHSGEHFIQQMPAQGDIDHQFTRVINNSEIFESEIELKSDHSLGSRETFPPVSDIIDVWRGQFLTCHQFNHCSERVSRAM